MTDQDPDEIRADIERTRHELSTNVDALGDKVSPSKVAQRQTDKVRNTIGGWKDRVLGLTDDATSRVSEGVSEAGDSVHSAAQDAADTAQRAPAEAKRRTQGNPIAAGLIALGAGWLVASILPASEQEKQAAAKLEDQAQPLVDEAKSQAQSMAEELKEPARESAQRVQASATESVETIKSEGQSQKDSVGESAHSTLDDLRGNS